MAKFLSQEWLADLTETLNSHDGFTDAIKNVDLSLQFEVSDAPDDAEDTYSIVIAEGRADATAGPLDDPDVTIANDYETAVAISKGELNTQMAFMTGKLKVSGNMAKLMMNQAMLGQFTAAASDMDVEY
ncbi:MAG: SCP2 sterol-binding domain-containing protein [Acidimicrobiia bacterium]|nr:SCP2 sterol-binding domain-containing protein [Acidimicrobiia bacterium]